MGANESRNSIPRRDVLATIAGATILTGASKTGLAQDNNESSAENESSNGGGNETASDVGGGAEEVITGPGGDLVFEPDSLEIAPGTTVRWVWDSDNHNVAPTEQPEESEWEGYTDIENTGFEYEYTFEVEGDYHYVCEPHVSAGMEGDITVDPSAAQGGGGGGPAQTVPDAAWTLIIATVSGMIAVLSLTYAFVRYGVR
ncbi:plastocyanin/azurin family copper-binding protein [Halomontanus rarus]|uniref:plastocyanin/azurin family copper-binding protein n=1 Tax=Halomontanus rarus TaxID=3034020 RepID=UPI0023E75A77|nr:plastocyanin/azurin family copper-binding protein [Halovivax sp. TS33]